MVLIMSVVGGSLIGVFANLVPAKGIYLKGTWRCGSFIFICTIFYILYGTILLFKFFVITKKSTPQKKHEESKRTWKEELKVCGL